MVLIVSKMNKQNVGFGRAILVFCKNYLFIIISFKMKNTKKIYIEAFIIVYPSL